MKMLKYGRCIMPVRLPALAAVDYKLLSGTTNFAWRHSSANFTVVELSW